MPPFEYHKASAEEVEQLGAAFCRQYGDDVQGCIADAEFDRLFDHLAEALSRYGTFMEGSGKADFKGCRYVDQIPLIATVPRDGASPATALLAGLEAVSTAHRPLAAAFDFYPEALLILPPNRVYTTFDRSALTNEANPVDLTLRITPLT